VLDLRAVARFQHWSPGNVTLVVGSRDTRREENQKLFRVGNERLRAAVHEQAPAAVDGRIPFLCECADEFCDGRVELRLEDWEGVARKPNHYVMVAGHPRSEGERVVGMLEGYDVVRKP
jgi:hypothetical protein